MTFDQWWDSDKPELADYPYRDDNAAYWAWAGWQAATLAERERAAKVCEENATMIGVLCAAAIRKGTT